MASFSETLSKLIEDALAKTDSSSGGNEAALVGGAAAAFKAKQMADLKAADLAKKSGESAQPTSQSLTTRGGAGGSGTGNALQIGEGTSGGNQLATRTGGELAQRTGGNEITQYEPRTMRNVTPQPKGAGISSVTSGAAALNPVAATLGALLASTETMGDATVRKEGDIQDLIAKGIDKPFQSTVDRLLAGVERDKAIAPFMKEANSAAGPISAPEITDRKAMPMATKEATVPDMKKEAAPVDMTKAEQLFKVTHGTPFDTKSSMDKRKMAEITSLLSQAGSDKLTPNQFALKIYRSHK